MQVEELTLLPHLMTTLLMSLVCIRCMCVKPETSLAERRTLFTGWIVAVFWILGWTLAVLIT